VPARDEAAGIEPAMRSLLAQHGPGLEIIAVDDRSTDGTGEILARLAAGDPRLTVLRVETLPEGWLGKTHAMHLATERARGEWLLFTDADVTMRPGAIRLALARARRERLAHLAVVPRLRARGALLRAVLLPISATVFVRYMAWRRRGQGLGVGAFNLVHAQAWRACGGHRRIALAVMGLSGAERWSYARLDTAVRRAGGAMLARGLTPGDPHIFRTLQPIAAHSRR